MKHISTFVLRIEEVLAEMCIRDRYKVAYDLKLNIPEDLSIVGFDNSIMSDVIAPHLTTYETPDVYKRQGKAIEEPC